MPFFGDRSLVFCSWSSGKEHSVIGVYALPSSHLANHSVPMIGFAPICEDTTSATHIFSYRAVQYCDDVEALSTERLGCTPISTGSYSMAFTVLFQTGGLVAKFGILNIHIPSFVMPLCNTPSQVPKLRATLVIGTPLIDHTKRTYHHFKVIGRNLLAISNEIPILPSYPPLWLHRLNVPHFLRQAELAKCKEVLPGLHPSANLWTGLCQSIGARRTICDVALDEPSGKLYILTYGKPGFQLHVADYA